MLKLSILILLSAVANSYFINSDYSIVTVQFPLYSQPISQVNYTRDNPNPLNSPTNWIWINGTTKKATIEHLFNGRFLQFGTLYVKANNTFCAYLNDVSVLTGWTFDTYTTSVNIPCGLNNLTFKVENTDPNATSSGLIFQLAIADASACSTNGYYNYDICSCDCLGNFTCSTGQKMIGYPVCGCKCLNQGVTTCNGFNQYFDTKSCGCKCFPTYCKPAYNLDQTTCTCKCKPAICSNATTWNYNQCRCL